MHSPIDTEILLTGSTGFLGRNLDDALQGSLNLTCLSRTGGDITCDLKEFVPDIAGAQFSHVVHCAGLAHNKGNDDRDFEKVNVQGTRNLLAALEGQHLRSMVFISSVSVYGLDEGHMIEETHKTQPTTAYGKSKLEAEGMVSTWCKDRNVPLLILRLPLVTGTNPPGNLAAMYRAVKRGYYMSMNQYPVHKSMVAARDIARWLPSALGKEGTYHLCDGLHPSMTQVEQRMAEISGKKIRKAPFGLVKMAAKVGDFLPGFPLNTVRLAKLNAELTFSDKKAREKLGWNPGPALDALDFTE